LIQLNFVVEIVKNCANWDKEERDIEESDTEERDTEERDTEERDTEEEDTEVPIPSNEDTDI